jgi:hypothetical protein
MKERMTHAKLRGIAEYVSEIVGYRLVVTRRYDYYVVSAPDLGRDLAVGLSAEGARIALRAVESAADLSYRASKGLGPGDRHLDHNVQ